MARKLSDDPGTEATFETDSTDPSREWSVDPGPHKLPFVPRQTSYWTVPTFAKKRFSEELRRYRFPAREFGMTARRSPGAALAELSLSDRLPGSGGIMEPELFRAR